VNADTASSARGAPARASLVIPVSRATAAGSAVSGSTKVTNRSPSDSVPSGASANRTAPISTMRSVSTSYPVVSRSIATNSRASAPPI
jgi:hypothetical protein